MPMRTPSLARTLVFAMPLTSAQFGSVIAEDVEHWKKLARQQNIVAD